MVSSSTVFTNFKELELQQLSYCFQLAYQCSNLGYISCIISKRFTSLPDIHNKPYNQCPELLEYIFFKYFSSGKEIINWCHDAHNSNIKPSVLFINNLEDFCADDVFEVVELCAALKDACNYCSTVNKRRFCHLVITISKEPCPKLSCLLSLFNNVFKIEANQSDKIATLLYPLDRNVESLTLYTNQNPILQDDIARCLIKKLTNAS